MFMNNTASDNCGPLTGISYPLLRCPRLYSPDEDVKTNLEIPPAVAGGDTEAPCRSRGTTKKITHNRKELNNTTRRVLLYPREEVKNSSILAFDTTSMSQDSTQ